MRTASRLATLERRLYDLRWPRRPLFVSRCLASPAGTPPGAGAGSGPSGAAPAAAPRGTPGLISPTGAPISSTRAGADGAAGSEVELTPQNAAQILQSQNAILLQVGNPEKSVSRKLNQLREGSGGRLPLVRLSCSALPQVCQALHIKSEPTILLMARGQVAAALENDLSPKAVMAFAERCAQLLGLKVDLAEGATEQLVSAEEVEWDSAASAEDIFVEIATTENLPVDARVRAIAGRIRCMLRLQDGRASEARSLLAELESGGHGRVPEVKQAMAMTRLLDIGATATEPLDVLKSAAADAPEDPAAVGAYAVGLFWAGSEGEAVDAGLTMLRKKKTEESRKLVLTLIEALGPRHPRYAKARKSFNNALFV